MVLAQLGLTLLKEVLSKPVVFHLLVAVKDFGYQNQLSMLTLS